MANPKTNIQTKPVDVEKGKCPDYDDGCKDVINPCTCFLGGFVKDVQGNIIGHIPTAKGYCPFVQNPN